MKLIFKQLKAFTLAEVLITLGIIGVVASLTIPTLMNNIRDMQYINAYKKSFSELAQIMSLIAQENEGTLEGLAPACATDSSDTAGGCRADVLKTFFEKKSKVIKSCSAGNSYADGCTTSSIKFLGKNRGSFSLNDAISIRFSSIVLSNGSTVVIRMQETWGGYFLVDVNGLKGPNTFAKDVYYINFEKSGKTIPFENITNGTNEGDHLCDPNDANTTGYGCGYVYLYEK